VATAAAQQSTPPYKSSYGGESAEDDEVLQAAMLSSLRDSAADALMRRLRALHDAKTSELSDVANDIQELSFGSAQLESMITDMRQ
jgi:hypothetical protein